MIKADNIITVGVDCSKLMGGVSAVEIEYSKIFNPWNHIATATTGNVLKKCCYFFTALIKFYYCMLAKREIKIVHIHGASYSSFWRKRIIVNIAKRFKKKVIFHCHGAEFKLFTAKHKRQVVKMLHKCDCVVCLSRSWQEWFEDECGCDNVKIIKNIIPNPDYKNSQDYSGELKLLFLGYLGKRKGIYDLIDVISTIHEVPVRLYYAGNGEVDNVVRKVKELNLTDKVEYLGWVGAEEKRNILNTSHVYVLPSYNEGLPISVLEAMSYHLPIISTNVGGIPEVVRNEENGFLIEAGDTEALRQAIICFAQNKGIIKTMGDISAEMVSDHLPQAVEAQLKDIYNSLSEDKIQENNVF